jgi:hypothetical protein
MKPTPGPWVIDWNVSRLDVFSSDAATLVATLRRSTLSDGIDKTAISNARLIAAAPDLLDACKEALNILESLQGGCTDSDDGTVEAITVWSPEVIEALIKVIAKATGEQQ